MVVDEILSSDQPPEKKDFDISYDEFISIFWKYKGLIKERERNNKFWESTNNNLKMAYEKLHEKEQELEYAYALIRDDLALANKIQKILLPATLKDLENKINIDVEIYNKQLTEVGGDYYDYFKTKSNNYAVGLFDISGHGVSAALVMVYLKSQLMQALNIYKSPRDIIGYVNEISLSFLREAKKYATVNFVLFEKNLIRYICGGGNGFIISKNRTEYFIKKDSFLGLRNIKFSEHELPFKKGDLLVLYTDGIIEAQNDKGIDFSAKRLHEIMKNNYDKPLDKILAICIEDYKKFRSKDLDDITLILLRKKD
jgi:sigma-B regulation protein RsbU (phosphoserine phosphatase)